MDVDETPILDQLTAEDVAELRALFKAVRRKVWPIESLAISSLQVYCVLVLTRHDIYIAIFYNL